GWHGRGRNCRQDAASRDARFPWKIPGLQRPRCATTCLWSLTIRAISRTSRDSLSRKTARMPEPLVNLAALEPLFAPHEEPNRHRARAQDDQPAQVKKGRRPSPITIAQNLRSHVKAWRETDYPGASDTTRELLHHWFGRDHLADLPDGSRAPFRYYFCQREAIETLIYNWNTSRG